MRDTLFHTEPELTPAQIAEITGLSADSQRDWRRRGVIEGIGVQQPNGRWLYDSFDALMLYVMRQLATSSMDLLGARWLCHQVCPLVVVAAIKAKGVDPEIPAYRFRIAYRDDAVRGGWSVARPWSDPINGPREPGDAPEYGAVSLLIDLRAIGASLPAHFDGFLPRVAAVTKAAAAKAKAEAEAGEVEA